MITADGLLALFPDLLIGEASDPGVECALQLDVDGVVRITRWTRVEPQPSAAEIDAVTQGQLDAAAVGREHEALVALLNTVTQREPKLVRALMLILLDELNLHALKINAILDAIDGAGTLAQVKTAVAAITDYPQRTRAQLVTALTAKINAGEADS